MLFELYTKYGSIFDNTFTFITLFVVVCLGIMVRNIWDSRNHITLTKTITGALFLTIIIFCAMLYLKMKLLTMCVPSLMAGLKCKELMKKYIKSDVNGVDPLNKFKGGK